MAKIQFFQETTTNCADYANYSWAPSLPNNSTNQHFNKKVGSNLPSLPTWTAPTRGATSTSFLDNKEQMVSTHAQRDDIITSNGNMFQGFQSTRPRRARLYEHHSTEYQYFTNIFPRTYPFAKISTASDSKNNQKLIDF